jgi:hypothetical protein
MAVDNPVQQKEYDRVTDKACLCVGLAASALNINNAATKADGEGVLICPGPNMAYFSSIVSLKEMIDHIYGRSNLIKRNERPHMFIKELKLYIDYMKDKIAEMNLPVTKNQTKYFDAFQKNIFDGIEYYKHLFSNTQRKIIDIKSRVDSEITKLEEMFEDVKKNMLILNLIPSVSEENQEAVFAAHINS